MSTEWSFLQSWTPALHSLPRSFSPHHRAPNLSLSWVSVDLRLSATWQCAWPSCFPCGQSVACLPPSFSLLTAFLFFVFKIRHSYLSLLFFPPRNFLWPLSDLISGDLAEQGSHFSVFEITVLLFLEGKWHLFF